MLHLLIVVQFEKTKNYIIEYQALIIPFKEICNETMYYVLDEYLYVCNEFIFCIL